MHIQRNYEKLDISNETDFPQFALFWKGYIKTLKAKGLGDTVHNKELSKEHLSKINALLVLLHKVMIGKPFIIDETRDPPVKIRNPEYDELLAQIPKKLNENGNMSLN